MRPLVKRGCAGSRGFLCIIPGSLGSKASISPRKTAVVMLIHKICVGVIGSVIPRKMARSITRPSPKLVGRVHVINFVRLSNTPLPSSTAFSIVAKLSSMSIISAESLATSVPVIPIAIPISAFFTAGASFTPSPVIATTWPSACSALTSLSFCSGVTLAKTLFEEATSFNSSSLNFSSSIPV